MSKNRTSTRRGPGRNVGNMSDLAAMMQAGQVTDVEPKAKIEVDIHATYTATAEKTLDPIGEILTRVVVGTVDSICPASQEAAPAQEPIETATKETTMNTATITAAASAFVAPLSIADMIRNQASATKDQFNAGLPELKVDSVVNFKTNEKNSTAAMFMSIYPLLPTLGRGETAAMRRYEEYEHVGRTAQDRPVIMSTDKNIGHCFIYSDKADERVIVLRGLQNHGFIFVNYYQMEDLTGRVSIMISEDNVAALVNQYAEFAAVTRNCADMTQVHRALCDHLETPEGFQSLMNLVGDIDIMELLADNDDKKEAKKTEIVLLEKKTIKDDKKEDKKN